MDVNLIYIDDEQTHIEHVHKAAKNMMFPRKGVPFEFNELLYRQGLENLKFFSLVDQAHDIYVWVGKFTFFVIILSDQGKQIHFVGYFVNFIRINFLYVKVLNFREYLIIVVPDFEDGVKEAFQIRSLIRVNAGPIVVYYRITEYVRLEQMGSFDSLV